MRLAAQVVEPEPLPEPQPFFIEGARLDTLDVGISVRDAAAVARYRLDLSNPGDFLAEGRIVVPVPPGSAVGDLVLSGGPETLEGRLLDSGDAERIYEDIVRRLIDPALLQSISDTLYEVRAFPVPPGERRSVSFTVTTPLTAEGNQVAVSVPWSRMSPRPASATVNADVDVSWEVRAAVAPTYSLASTRDGPGRLSLSWESGDGWSPATDFRLDLSGGEGLLSTRLLSYRPSDAPGYFALLFAPVTQITARVDRDLILVLDRSGSMQGGKLAQAKQAARFMLNRLGDGDRYGVVSFASTVSVFGEGLTHAADAAAGIAHVDGLVASGSTNIAGALATALDLAGGERPATVVFLTDGLPTVGPEDPESILAVAQGSAAGRTQIFTFGVGYDVDTVLLDALARDFLGTSHYVTPDERLDVEVGRLFERIATPVLTGVEIEFDGGGVSALAPERITGIFAGTQVLLAGRYAAPGAATIIVRGETAAGPESFRYEVSFPERAYGDPTVAQVWAQQRIAGLLTELRLEGARDSLVAEIVAIATRFGIVTPFTSFLAEEPDLALEEEEAEDALADAAATAPASGQAAVGAASDIEALREGDLATGTDALRVVGDRSFVLRDGIWTETDYEDEETVEHVVGSAEFGELLRRDPGVAAVAALGPIIVARSGDAFVRIVWPDPDDASIDAALAVALVGLSASPNPVDEGADVTVTATLSAPLQGDVVIPVMLTAGTAEPDDYGALASIAIAAGETSGTGTVGARRDADAANETFTVTLGSLPETVVAGSPPLVTVMIEDVAVAGRIQARRLIDGQVEVGFRPTGGDLILPAQRVIPADARVDRWLVSSEVVADGVVVGRITARLLPTGEIEFGFNPVAEARILPRSRFVPADTEVGRWLRSSPISVMLPGPSLRAPDGE
jgi:Ca-activated chloride channel family protein